MSKKLTRLEKAIRAVNDCMGVLGGPGSPAEEAWKIVKAAAVASDHHGHADPDALVAALAHRVCHSAEHDPEHGRIHGYCMVCGVPWPCETAKQFLVLEADHHGQGAVEELRRRCEAKEREECEIVHGDGMYRSGYTKALDWVMREIDALTATDARCTGCTHEETPPLGAQCGYCSRNGAHVDNYTSTVEMSLVVPRDSMLAKAAERFAREQNGQGTGG